MKATLVQLAWYIERDGATVRHDGDDQVVTAPALGGYVTWRVPGHMVDALNAERDKVYPQVAAKRRAAARQ